MWRNYLTIGLRNFIGNKLFSIINVFGLAVGLASVIVIGLYVKYESSYDRFFPDSDRIYRVMTDLYPVNGQQQRKMATNYYPAADLLKADFPEVVEVARLLQSRGVLARDDRDDLLFSEPGLYYADAAVFRIFRFEWLQGDPATALDEPNSVVITERIARKYFGNEDALGRRLKLVSRGRDLQVTGVIRDLPANSHMAPTIITNLDIMIDFLGEDVRSSWRRANAFHTYVKLAAGANIGTVASGLPAFLNRHVAEDASSRMGMTTIPVSDIHLRSTREQELRPPGSMAAVLSLTAVALGILLIATVNFMNLATARSMLRAKEVGVRKAVGAERRHLIVQFLGESIGMTLVAASSAIAIVEVVLPAFEVFSGMTLSFDLLRDTGLAAGLLALVLVVGCLAGTYPAFYLSSFKPARVLRGRVAGGPGDLLFRNLLVVLQFSIAIVLVVATAVVALQNRYTSQLDLGFDTEQVVVITATQGLTKQWETLKNELLQHPGITQAAAASTVPGSPLGIGNAAEAKSSRDVEPHELWRIYVDYGFFETYNIHLLAGRLFSEEFAADRMPIVWPPSQAPLEGNFVLNASAAREFGWKPEEAIGQAFEVRDTGQLLTGHIVGVVADSHFESLRIDVKPLAFYLAPPGQWANVPVFSYAVVRITGDNLRDTLDHIDRAWRSVTPDAPVDRSFLGDRINAFYQQDKRLGQLLSSFAALAILVACLGLFGLATFNAQRRMKEIGIRKVMGGSVWRIVLLLTNDFSKLVLLSNVIAWPVAYFAMNRWLENFAYRIDLTPLIFVASGVIASGIAWVTVGGTAAKAASAKPVLALRYE
jgi:putative ABC transport system permease protein